MKCPNCDRNVSEQDAYCPGCGTALKSGAVGQNVPPVPAGKHRSIGIILLSAAACIALIGLLIMLFTGKQAEPEPLVKSEEKSVQEVLEQEEQKRQEGWSYAGANVDYKVLKTTPMASKPGGEAVSSVLADEIVRLERIASRDSEMWGETTDGWLKVSDADQTYMELVLLHDSSQFTGLEYEILADSPLYGEPSTHSPASGKLNAGEVIELSAERSDPYGTVWGKTENGWLILKTPMKAYVQEFVAARVQEPQTKTEVVYVPVPDTSSYSPAPYYILPGSSSSYLSRSDISGLSRSTLELARNEIYARRHRKFATDYIQDYFNNQIWYSGTIAPESFDEAVFNVYERANIDLIVKYEQEMGWR